MIRAGICGRRGLMKWKDLNGETRYRVVQMAREGKVSIKALCRSFGVSRQSLRTAVDKADQAAMEALTPKSPGRKGKSKEQAKAEALKQEKASLEKELDHWKQKYEIAMTFVDIHKKLLNGEELSGKRQKPNRPGGKKRRKDLGNPGSKEGAVADRTGAEVEHSCDG
jgi:transposase-like protein